MKASVVIPTYNRRESLQQTLLSLQSQSLPPDDFEVIIVDDGSTDGTEQFVAGLSLPFSLQYYRQQNQGGIAAANFGAAQARNEVLVFVDDDMVVTPGFLHEYVQCHSRHQRVIAIGSLHPFANHTAGLLERAYAAQDSCSNAIGWLGEECEYTLVHYIHCCSGTLSIKKADYFEIGAMESLGNGVGAWGDIEFGYRAAQRAYRIVRAPNAIAFHNDGSLSSLSARCRRQRLVGRQAVLLFRKHPELKNELEMFQDMGYVSWGSDSFRVIVRKLMRGLTVLPPVLWVIEGTTKLAETFYPSLNLLRPLYRWTLGTYVCRGYREGLKAQRG